MPSPKVVALATLTGPPLILGAAGVVLGIGCLVALTAAPLLAAMSARRAIRDTAVARAELSSGVLALLDGLPQLAVAGVLPDRLDAIKRLDRDLSAALDRAARPAAWAAGLSTAAMATAMLGCLATGIQSVERGQLSPVILAVVTLIPLALAEVMTPLPLAAAGLVRGLAAAERISSLLDVPEGAPSGQILAEQRGLPITRGESLHLQARGLSCGWPGRPPLLTGLDLNLPPGSKLAVAGPSGQGKTTLLMTLAGLIPPMHGEVLLNGISLSGYDQRQLRRAVHYTAEDEHIFTTTVRENVRIACPGAGDSAIVDALAQAGLASWLDGLPAGLETVITDPAGPGQGPGLHILSGGERRRLLLARAFISGAEILLIDEPAEHVDADTAGALLDELFARPATVVLVTHSPAPGAVQVLMNDLVS